MTLTATNLSKTTAGQQILSCIDISLAPGTLTCVIGPSGAGKTTLLRALAMIEAFDMAHFIDSYPNQASQGQRQRIALARALMLKPRYILMEEIIRVAQRINAQIYKPVEIYTALGVFFLAVCLPLNGLAMWLKHRFMRDLSER